MKSECITYTGGHPALVSAEDGSSFAYYASGHVAAVVTTVNSYQRRTFFFEHDRRGSLIGAFDENGVGFALEHRKGSQCRMVLSKSGGILTDAIGMIVKEGPWPINSLSDPGPFPEVTIRLNDCFTFTFKNRLDMCAVFVHQGVSKIFDLGVKQRRYDTYLDHAAPALGATGKLNLTCATTTLRQRANEFNEIMKDKRSKLHPRSKDLVVLRDVVATLEADFDAYGDKVTRSVAYVRPGWKEAALEKTVAEVPHVPLSGQEVMTDKGHGLGTTMYFEAEKARQDGLDKAQAIRMRDALVKEDGSWKTDLDVRKAVMSDNPLLPRSQVLSAASGRYCAELVVAGGPRSATNPTGKATAVGVRLETLSLKHLTGDLRPYARPDQLLVLLCTRADDPACRRAEKVCEALVDHLQQGALGTQQQTEGQRICFEAAGGLSGTALARFTAGDLKEGDFRLYKVEMTESRALVDRLNVRSTPQFLMYYDGRLVYEGMLAGGAIRTHSRGQTRGLHVLLVEARAKDQTVAEKALKKYGCSWHLRMSSAEALRLRQVATTTHYDMVMLSEDLPLEDVKEIQHTFSSSEGRRALICGMATVSGEEGAERVKACKWERAMTKDVQTLFRNSAFASSCDVGVTKPVKVLAIETLIHHAMAARATQNHDESGSGFCGATTRKLYDAMLEALQRGKKGHFVVRRENAGISLQASEVIVAGTVLGKNGGGSGTGQSVKAW